ncbi:tyrosine-type recombinase/integrase [Streptomyces sp. NPDC019531]|uniref:tyrosine-type recombinase/integrase n=1 Tax=Streptomyces sp. NPDC019531 TaxID=3365062 RepID=UPI00384CB338
MADVYDRWHKTFPKPDEEECPEHKGKVPTADHGKGKRWQVRYRDHLGQQRKENFERKIDAEKAAASVETKLHEGTYIDPNAGKKTLKTYAGEWVDARSVGMGTGDAYEGVVRNHIEPHLGHLEIRALNRPSLIQGWVKKLQSAGLEASTIGWINSVLSAVLDAAVEDGLLPRNPCKSSSVKLPTVTKKKIIPWSLERVHAVTAALPPRFRCGGKLSFGCGLRQGEVFGFAEDQIDFERGVVHVNRQIKLVRSTMVFALPKGNRLRTIPLPDALAEALKAHMKEFPPVEVTLPWAEPDGEERTFRLLFTDAQKRAYHRGVFNQYPWKKALATAGVIPPREKGSPRFAAAPDDGMHAYRHAYASVLLDAGESIKALSEYLGHSDAGFTLRTYTHLMPNSESRTRRAMDAALAHPGHSGTGATPPAPANAEGTPGETKPSGMCPACALAA